MKPRKPRKPPKRKPRRKAKGALRFRDGRASMAYSVAWLEGRR